jgi:SAM-dependent methyltransferase
MSALSALQRRNCPICGTNARAGIPFLDRHVNPARLGRHSFSSRKLPEYMCFTLLRCPVCDVVYACESPGGAAIDDAYQTSTFDSRQEAIDAAETYERALIPHLTLMTDRRGGLDIGAGTGAFLQRLQAHGFTELIGVEPSRAAVQAADAQIRPFIREEAFQADRFRAGSLSLITCFMTLEHVLEPATLIRDCWRLLRPGGLMASVVHDWRAWNNRLLGRYSPIVDIEHLQLFSKASILELHRRAGFVETQCERLWNRYSVDYWNRLLPTPLFLKRGLASALRKTGIGQVRFAMNVGNLMVVGHREADSDGSARAG